MAELRDILQVEDFTVHITVATNLGNTLSTAEIDQALVDSGNQNPKMNDVSFFLTGSNATFTVTWLQGLSKYVYIKTKIAS